VAELIDKSGYYKAGGPQATGRERCRS